MIATSTVTSQQSLDQSTTEQSCFAPDAISSLSYGNDQGRQTPANVLSTPVSSVTETGKKGTSRRRIGATPKEKRIIDESPITPPLTSPPIPGKIYNIQNQQTNSTALDKYSDHSKLLINNVASKSNGGICADIPSNNKLNQLFLNNIEYDEKKQQQQLGKSDRMSKEKQKFFRHSAFNSDRVVKTSPTSTVNKQTRTNISIRTLTCKSPIATSLPSPPQLSGVYTPLIKDNDRDQVNSMDYRNNIIATQQPQQKEYEKHLSDDSSSDSSSDDDRSSSSCSSSSSDDEDSNTSSSKSSSSDIDDEEFSEENQSVGWSSLSRKTLIDENNQKIDFQLMTQQKHCNIEKNCSWGFAAEAKKNFDIFRKTTSQNERVFGNFDGIDKDSLVKISARSQLATATLAPRMPSTIRNQKPNSEVKESAQVKGLFDSLSHVFSTSDFTRSRNNNSSPPNYKLSGKRKKHDPSEHVTPKIVLKETRSTFRDYKEQRLLEKLKATSSSSSREISHKTDFSNFLIASNNIINKFAINNVNNTEAKEQFGRKFFTTSKVSIGSKPLVNVAVDLADSSTKDIFTPSTQIKESSTVFRPSTSKFTTSLTKKNIDSSSTTNVTLSNSPPKTPRRIIPITLPLDRENLRQYYSSSDDDIPYLTPSNLVKNAINSQANDRHHSLSIFKNSDNSLFGACSIINNMDFASIRDSRSSMPNYSCGPPPYNKNDLLGKTCGLKTNNFQI